jgi:hypothetical protein
VSGVRKYEVPVCTGCGGVFPGSCSCEGSITKTGKVVTAYDARDVDPLAEQGALAIAELERLIAVLGPQDTEFAEERIQALALVLAPFETVEEGK